MVTRQDLFNAKTQQDIALALERIAAALERIAPAIEKQDPVKPAPKPAPKPEPPWRFADGS